MWFWSNKEVSPKGTDGSPLTPPSTPAAAEEVVIEKEVVESKAGEKTINDLEKENEELKEKLKNHKSVLFEGALKNGRKISIQYYDEDDTFRVIAKKTNDLLFRSPDLSALILYKKTNIV